MNIDKCNWGIVEEFNYMSPFLISKYHAYEPSMISFLEIYPITNSFMKLINGTLRLLPNHVEEVNVKGIKVPLIAHQQFIKK